SSAWMSVFSTSWIEAVTNAVLSYTISPDSPVGSCDTMSGIVSRTRCATSRMFASGATLMPMNTAILPLKETLKSESSAPSTTLGTTSTRTIAPPDAAVVLLPRQLSELVDRVQIGAGREVDADHLSLGGTDGGEIVVSG